MDPETPLLAALAWAAGIFEGEGCFAVQEGRPSLHVRNCDLEVLQRFLDALGGRGRIYGPYIYKAKDGYKRQPFYHWAAFSFQAYETFRDMAPFLSTRRLKRGRELFRIYGCPLSPLSWREACERTLSG